MNDYIVNHCPRRFAFTAQMAVVHFTILRAVPNNTKVFLRCLLNMLEKQILTSVIEIQKKIRCNHAFIKNNLSRIFV